MGIYVIYINEIMPQGLSEDKNFRPLQNAHNMEKQNNKGHNAAYVNWIRAREIDKCKSVQPFHKWSAISVSFMETTDRAHGNCRSAVSVTIGLFLIYGKECVLTLNSIIFPSYTLFLVIFGFKKTVSNISDIRW